MIHERDRSTWPELVYRFIEHYKWEKQHLRGSIPEFSDRLLRQEPPLNFLFNILLRCSSPQTIFMTLREFGLEDDVDGARFRLEYPQETKVAQPDVRIESDNARIYIEVKIEAPIELDQIQKYLLLHAQMDVEFGQKRPYLFFLTKNEFRECWRPRGEIAGGEDVQQILEHKTTGLAIPELISKKLRSEKVVARYNVVRREIRYGATTWKSVGRCLAAISSQLQAAGSQDIEVRIIDDFVKDLERRRLI